MTKHEITDWQFYWRHWWKLVPYYNIIVDYETYTPPIISFTFCFGPFQCMGYVSYKP